MLNFINTLIIASLLLPSGFNFLIQRSADFSFPSLAITKKITGPQRINNKSLGLKTVAKSILVVDDASGSTLYSKNQSAVLPIASISKLMTALVILDTKPDWSQVVKITKEDEREGGMVYFFEGEEVTVKDLFNAMLVASSNEAAIALARISGFSDFSAAMNKKAAELKMSDSYFLDPSGLNPKNVSSAGDLVKLANAAFARPEIAEATKALDYKFEVLNNQRVGRAVNTDKLLDSYLNKGDYKIIGAKTGHLDEAGYCLLLRLEKKDIGSLTLVLMGIDNLPNRWQETKGLVDWVLDNYQW
ncbi:MAG: serine hydrolase [Candidatus Buchananbacteria bacterium]